MPVPKLQTVGKLMVPQLVLTGVVHVLTKKFTAAPFEKSHLNLNDPTSGSLNAAILQSCGLSQLATCHGTNSCCIRSYNNVSRLIACNFAQKINCGHMSEARICQHSSCEKYTLLHTSNILTMWSGTCLPNVCYRYGMTFYRDSCRMQKLKWQYLLPSGDRSYYVPHQIWWYFYAFQCNNFSDLEQFPQ